jgi:hypothetical protein
VFSGIILDENKNTNYPSPTPPKQEIVTLFFVTSFEPVSLFKRLANFLMKKTLFALLFAPLLSLAQVPVAGLWRASLSTHGGELPIQFEINPGSKTGNLDIKLINGAEKSTLGESYFRADSLVVPFDLYEAELVFQVTKTTEMKGYFVKKRNGVSTTRFSSSEFCRPLFEPTTSYRECQWKVDGRFL